jgi:Protein of unknown function DUF111
VRQLVTPTGASLVKVLCDQRFGRPPAFLPFAVGIGAGTKDFDKHPNILRVVLGELTTATSSGSSTSSSSSVSTAGAATTGAVSATAAAKAVAVQHSSSTDAATATLPNLASLTVNDNSSNGQVSRSTSISSGDTTASTAVCAHAHYILTKHSSMYGDHQQKRCGAL